MRFKLELNESYCKGCELCVKACKSKVLAMADHINALGYKPTSVAEPEKCNGCKACAMVCPDAVFTIFQLPQESIR